MDKKIIPTERVMIGSGEHACFIKTGLTEEEERKKIKDELNNIMYNKPVALVKKIVRKSKNK